MGTGFRVGAWLVMSGSLTLLLLLLWVCGPDGGYAAILILPNTEPQGLVSGAKSLQKRSPENGQVEGKVEVLSLKVDCMVASRFAHTVLTSKVVNRANTSREVFFDMDLPKTAFITNFSMEIDGMTYVGQIKEKEKAKKQYEKAVSLGQTASLVKASGRKLEKFSVSVNVAALSDVTFTLTHEELLLRSHGYYELLIRVQPKQLIQKFEIVADIYEPQGIAFLDAYGTFITNDLLSLVEKSHTDTKGRVSFCPTLEQQRSCPSCDGTQIDGDFLIKYDVRRDKPTSDIQIVNGYFVHYFAPTDLPRVPKNVVFVIDISGSMYGEKIRQTRQALLTILGDLDEDDHFAIILFHINVETWRPALTKATAGNVSEAKDFVRTINTGSATNINDAMMKAVEMLYHDKAHGMLPDRSVSMVILLTDGRPNEGESNPQKIQENVFKAIGGNITVFCLGFGYDLNYQFLDVMAQQNNGLARRIYVDSDAELQLQGFYSEVASPLLSEVDLRYPGNTVESLTKSHFKQFFNGSEIVVAGRLLDNDLDNFLFEVSAQGVEEELSLKGQATPQDWKAMFPDEEYIFGDFTERLWAYLTIQQLLSKREKGTLEEKRNATADALDLSLRYNFVTPLTSMVVTKPERDLEMQDEFIADKLTEDQRQSPTPNLGSSGYRHSSPVTSGSSGYRHSSPVTSVDGDPHFIVEVEEQNDTLCFNIDDVPGTIFNLVRDPGTGVIVNGQTIGDKKVNPGSKVNTYFGQFGIMHQKLGVRLKVTTQTINVFQDGSQLSLSWSDTGTFKGASVDLQVTKDRSLTISLKDSVKFIVILHRVWEKHPYHQNYLGFYTLDAHLLSPGVHGLLGQFYHGLQFQVRNLHEGQDLDKLDATMLVKGSELTVTRGWQRDFRQDVKNGEMVPCWFVHNNGTGLIDGTHHDYVVSGIFETS